MLRSCHRRRTGYDSWLTAFHDDVLAPLDAACAEGAPLSAFAGLEVDLWGILLTQQYRAYPHIRAALPDVPEPALQERFSGLSGVPLAVQSAAFYRLLTQRYARARRAPAHRLAGARLRLRLGAADALS